MVASVEQQPTITLSQTSVNLSFHVTDVEKLNQKVNGAAQYVFQVEFGHRDSAKKLKAAIPLHAASMTRALMLLETFGRSVSKMGSGEFEKAVKGMGYSAVTIEHEQPSMMDKLQRKEADGYTVAFNRYDAHTGKFASKNHLKTTIDKKTHAELERYAKELESRTKSSQDEGIDPTVKLQRREKKGPYTDVTLVQVPKESKLETAPLHNALTTYLLHSDDEEGFTHHVKPYDRILGKGFTEEVKEAARGSDRPLEEILAEKAWLKASVILTEEQREALAKTVSGEDQSPTIEDFTKIVDAVNTR